MTKRASSGVRRGWRVAQLPRGGLLGEQSSEVSFFGGRVSSTRSCAGNPANLQTYYYYDDYDYDYYYDDDYYVDDYDDDYHHYDYDYYYDYGLTTAPKNC